MDVTTGFFWLPVLVVHVISFSLLREPVSTAPWDGIETTRGNYSPPAGTDTVPFDKIITGTVFGFLDGPRLCYHFIPRRDLLPFPIDFHRYHGANGFRFALPAGYGRDRERSFSKLLRLIGLLIANVKSSERISYQRPCLSCFTGTHRSRVRNARLCDIIRTGWIR